MNSIALEPKSTKIRLAMFRKALMESIDKEELAQLDQWVDLGAKSVRLSLLFLTLLATIPLLENTIVSIPLISGIIAIFGALIVELGYRYAVIRQWVDVRVKMVAFSIYLLVYGSLYGVLSIIQYFFPNDLIERVIPAIIVVASIFIIDQLLSKRVRSFIWIRVQNTVSETMRPFDRVISTLAMRFVSKARTSAGPIMVGLMFVLFLIPHEQEYLWALGLFSIFVVVLVMEFLRTDSFVDSLDLIWDIAEDKNVVDLLSYCLLLRNRLEKLGIEYEVVFNWESCVKTSQVKKHFLLEQVLTFFMLEPDGFARILLITTGEKKPDLYKVKKLLGENWSKSIGVERLTLKMLITDEVILGTVPPFISIPDSWRIIVDKRVLERPVVAWVSGKPCFGVVFDSKDLLKLSPILGEIS